MTEVQRSSSHDLARTAARMGVMKIVRLAGEPQNKPPVVHQECVMGRREAPQSGRAGGPTAQATKCTIAMRRCSAAEAGLRPLDCAGAH